LVEILDQAKRALAGSDGDPPHLLVVDDAQRLDAGSGELTEVLGAAVAAVATRRLWEASGDNALFLKELVLEATSTGALRHDRGSWRLDGAPRAPSRPVELIGARLAALGDGRLASPPGATSKKPPPLIAS
jgi:hypothetical protein